MPQTLKGEVAKNQQPFREWAKLIFKGFSIEPIFETSFCGTSKAGFFIFDIMNPEINISYFQLKQAFFDNESNVHGINHTYRVMCHVLYIGESAGLQREVLLALCAAFMHDFARKHDGFCDQHGKWAAQNKLSEFAPLFFQAGVKKFEIEIIRTAVKNHSELEELSKDHIAYKVTSLLKDADALDRIRLNANNLDERYLRFPESVKFITFANQLYFNSRNVKISSFAEILKIAELINQ